MSEQIIKDKLNKIIDLALEEDLGQIGDVTSNLTIPEDRQVTFQIVNRQKIMLCGVHIALSVFDKVSKEQNIKIQKHFEDGEYLEKRCVIISGSGSARIIFAAERIALNLMQHLSGIATKTSE